MYTLALVLVFFSSFFSFGNSNFNDRKVAVCGLILSLGLIFFIKIRIKLIIYLQISPFERAYFTFRA